MRRMLLCGCGVRRVFTCVGCGAQAPPKSAEAGKTTWYFYTVKWGHQDEFLDLFQTQSLPDSEGAARRGRLQERSHLRADEPWRRPRRLDLRRRVERSRPNPPEVDEPALVRKLFPDQGRFQKEEQRRFEILVAHWDVPLNVIDFDDEEITRNRWL